MFHLKEDSPRRTLKVGGVITFVSKSASLSVTSLP